MSLIVRALAILGVVLGLFASAAVAQRLGPPKPLSPVRPAEPGAPEKPHRTGELDCKNCHVGEHQGVLQMYLGMGGRGTPMIPSHMFQVRVECVACHIVPKEAEQVAGIVGQTFRPSEQACIGCHGERYRGMLERWNSTLAKMRGLMAQKAESARVAMATADPSHPRLARAKKLTDDAEFNIRFVTLGKGVHNVFYAADLLKLSNSWLDEAFALLEATPPKSDDTLIRGGYCGVLCHEQAAVKQPETVKFGRQQIPHVRHVTELGAVCTACHSAEVHKAVTATAATCASCHHSPQNERCESCHRQQSAFYRGEVKFEQVKVEPSNMANVVSCTGCHDFTKKHSRQAVGQKCVGCHDKAYLSFLTEWTVGLDKEVAKAAETLKRAEAALARAKLNKASEPGKLVKEAGEALALVRKARGVHNPQIASALLDRARQKAEAALAQVNRR
jgi:hypothetical protein